MVYSAFAVDQMSDIRTESSALPVVAPASREPARRRESTYRGPEDDFYCLRFEVWYSSVDCAIRTRYRTCPSCVNCDQGRFNAKRHGTTLLRIRVPLCEA